MNFLLAADVIAKAFGVVLVLLYLKVAAVFMSPI